MLEPKGDRKSCSQIKKLLHQTKYLIRTLVSRPPANPPHTTTTLLHTPPAFPSLANPHRPRPPCNLLPPTVPSCAFLLPWQLPAGVQLGGHLRRGFFLPTHFLPPLQNATPPIQIPASFANALRTTPYCKSPPPPLLQIPARPSELPPCQSPRVEILLPLPCPLFCKSLPPLPPFFQTCALKSAWSTCLQTFSAKLPLVDSCCSTQSMSAIVCSRRRQALFKWAARRLQAADPFHLGGCNGLQVGCKEAAPRSHRRDRWTTTRVPSVFIIIYSVLHVNDLNVTPT